MTNQQWNDMMAARKSQPDGTIEVVNGREWARIHPKLCPICSKVFFAYKPLDADWEPYRADPNPPYDAEYGTRETCGHPACEKAEDEDQFKRRHGASTRKEIAQ